MSSTVEVGVRRVFATWVTWWQVVMICAVLVTPATGWLKLALLLVHGLMVGLGVLFLRGRLTPLVLLSSLLAVLVLDYSAAELGGILHFETVWHAIVIFIMTPVLLRRRVAVAFGLATAAVLPTAVALVQPVWEPPFVLVSLAVVVNAAAQVGMWSLRGFVREADLAADQAEQQRHAVVLARESSSRSADDARILHDTVINTLGAVANGGASIGDFEAVRACCARDGIAIAHLLDGREVDEEFLTGAAADFSIEVRRSGLAAEDLLDLDALVGRTASRILRGCVQEAIRNAERHSGAAWVEVSAAVDELELVVDIVDHGVGFEGMIQQGRGLSVSLFGPARLAGIQVDLQTAPSEGVRVTFRCPLQGVVVEAPELPPDVLDLQTATRAILGRTCWALVVSLIVASTAMLPVTRPGEFHGGYLAQAVCAVAAVLAWIDTRRGHSLSTPVVALQLVGIPATFLFGFAAVDWGRSELNTWQPISVAVPMMILFTFTGDRSWRVVSWAVAFLTVVATSAAMAPISTVAAVAAVIGAAPFVATVLGWLSYTRTIDVVIVQMLGHRRSAWLADSEAVALRVADRARDRWRAAGLRDTADLLRQIATGEADPTNPAVQVAAGREEAYLRQLIRLSPSAVQMAPWLCRALAAARARAVELTVRTGDVDAPDSASAELLGSGLLAVVQSSPVGAGITLGIFRCGERIQFTLSGDHPHVRKVSDGWAVPATWQVGSTRLGDRDLIEVRWPVPDDVGLLAS